MSGFTTITCGTCKEEFAIKTELYNVLRRNQQTFYCPHGHKRYYPLGPTEEDKLRQERDRLTQQLAQKDDAIAAERRRGDSLRDQRDYEQRRVAAAKGQVTRLKNRAAAGVCPCCNRSFQNLQRHMAHQHPGFPTEKQEADNVVLLKGAKS